MRVSTAWQAIDQNPLRFLASAWPWRSLLYLLSGVLVAAASLLLAGMLAAGTLVLLIFVIGLALLMVLALSGVAFGRLERRRLRLVDLDKTPDPHREPLDPGLRGWLATRLRERATWRELGFAVLASTALGWLDLLVLSFTFGLPVVSVRAPVDDPTAWPWAIIGVVVFASWPWSVTAWAGARAALTRMVLGPRDSELGSDISDIGESRQELVAAFESERSRIERDLHDGAQQRLASMSMSLGLARLDVPDGSDLADHLDTASAQLATALSELRDLVRGLKPQVLRDNGLAAALEDTASRCSVLVTIDVKLPRRLPEHIETTAYFVFAEALANIAKHSGATAARLFSRHRTDTLLLEIIDNGAGGADPRTGSGLTGLAGRIALVDGRLRLSSPSGGPTLLRAELPCRFE